jgi:uncharacterized protein (TIGR02246 family)
LKRRSILSTIVAAVLVSMSWLTSAGQEAVSQAAGSPDEQAVRAQSQALVQAYNQGDVAALAALFCPAAELMDDAGNVFKGREEITAIYTKFIEEFPGAQMELNIDSLRFPTGDLAIEDGTRTVTTADGNAATNRYTLVHVRRDGKWSIASARELPDDPAPTPYERLQPLAWMVGDWVDEGAEVSIKISCRWAESRSFLLVDFDAATRGETAIHSTQRIGWDPLTGRVRSWVFDSDGGYGSGDWTEAGDRWIIKSTAVLPDGTTGSATMILEPTGEDKFVMQGFDRILGNAVEPDFQAVIVRQPPEPSE